MSYNKTMFGNTYSVPESGNKNVGVALTAIIDDLMDGVEGVCYQTGGGIILTYLRSTTSSLAAAATLTRTHPIHKVSGSGAAVTLSGTTAIASGTKDGETLVLQGDHASNTVTINNGANTQMRGNCTLALYDTLSLRWDSTIGDWIEIGRTNGQKYQNQSGIELYELVSNGTNKITMRAPASLAGDLTLTWPATVTNGNFLMTDGSGNLSWSTSAPGTFQSAYTGGSGVTITAANPILLTGTTTEDYFKLTSTANDPSITIAGQTSTANTRLIMKTSAATATVGNISNHPLALMTNNTARINITAAGEVGVGGAAEATVAFKVVGGDILTDNNKFHKQRNSVSSILKIIGITSGDILEIGDSSQGNDVNFKPTGSYNIGGTQSAGKLEVAKDNGAGTASSQLVLRSPTVSVNGGSVLSWLTGSGAGSGTNALGGIACVITQTGPLKSDMVHSINTGDSSITAFTISDGALKHSGNNGQITGIKWKRTSQATTSGTDVTVANFFPPGAIVLGVTVRITTTITGPASISLGNSTSLTRYLNAWGTLGAGTTIDCGIYGSETAPRIYVVAESVNLRITANGGNYTGGQIEVILHYIDLTPPTS